MRFRKFKKRINKDNKYLKNTLRRNLTGCGGGECVEEPRAEKRRAGWPPPSAEPKSEAAPAADCLCYISVLRNRRIRNLKLKFRKNGSINFSEKNQGGSSSNLGKPFFFVFGKFVYFGRKKIKMVGRRQILGRASKLQN